jgi:hypothetical protein
MMASPSHPGRRSRGLSISFDPSEAEWVDRLVALLKEADYPKARRSEVVRIALFALQDALAECTRADIVRYFAQRDAARLVATVDGTTPRLPSM